MRPVRTILAILLAVFLGLGVLPTAKADTTDTERKAEVRLFELINSFRVNKGLAPLVEHEVIREQAREHAQRMSDEAVLSHTGFNARTVRISHADPGIPQEEICENVAKSPLPGAGTTAKMIFRAWKKSPTHKLCVLGPDYTTQSGAVGAEYDGDDWWVVFIAAHDDTP